MGVAEAVPSWLLPYGGFPSGRLGGNTVVSAGHKGGLEDFGLQGMGDGRELLSIVEGEHEVADRLEATHGCPLCCVGGRSRQLDDFGQLGFALDQREISHVSTVTLLSPLTWHNSAWVKNSGLNVHFNLALGLCTAAQFEDAFARFLPPEPNIRTLKRGAAKRRESVRIFG
jgi:hypothetical protein